MQRNETKLKRNEGRERKKDKVQQRIKVEWIEMDTFEKSSRCMHMYA